MSAAAVLDRLRTLGIAIKVDGSNLRLRPASAATPDILTEVRQHKLALLTLFGSQSVEQVVSETAREPLAVGVSDRNVSREDTRAVAAPYSEQPAVSADISVAMQRPPSWADVSALPSIGCWCSCCGGRRWRCDNASGWHCSTCHPPANGDLVREVRT